MIEKGRRVHLKKVIHHRVIDLCNIYAPNFVKER